MTRPEPTRATRGRSKLWWRLGLVAALLTAAVLLFDIRAVGAAVVSIPPAVLILAILLGTLDRCLMGFKWRQLIQAGGERFRIRDAISAYYQSSFTGRLIPAAAAHDVLRGYVASRCGVSSGMLVGSIALEKVIGMFASVVTAGLGLAYLSLSAGLDAGTRILLAAAVGAGGVVSAGALFIAFSPQVHRWSGRLVDRWAPKRLVELARKVSRASLAYRHRRRALLVNFLLAVGEYGLHVLKLLVLALGLGISMPLASLSATIALATYARRVIAYVESWGLAEAGGIATFVLLGIDSDLAFALAVANYAVTTLTVLPGGYLLYRTGSGRDRPVAGPADQAPYDARTSAMWSAGGGSLS